MDSRGTWVNQQRIQTGNRVTVINPDSQHYARTGQVETLVSYVGGAGGPFSGPPESRGWRVLFNWPLGGLGGWAILREQELEVVPRF